MTNPNLDPAQAAAAAQFDRQSDRYGKSHILADTADDIAPRMLENACQLATEAGHAIETRLFPAEEIPFPAASFTLVSARVAPHHFSSPDRFVAEVARVLAPGGHFVLIDGTVPDDDPESEAWMHRIEKWRDPSHERFLSRAAWEDLVRRNGLTTLHSALHQKKQPDLQWYFDTANTSPANRALVLDAIRQASPHVRAALHLEDNVARSIWWWPMLTLVARKS